MNNIKRAAGERRPRRGRQGRPQPSATRLERLVAVSDYQTSAGHRGHVSEAAVAAYARPWEQSGGRRRQSSRHAQIARRRQPLVRSDGLEAPQASQFGGAGSPAGTGDMGRHIGGPHSSRVDDCIAALGCRAVQPARPACSPPRWPPHRRCSARRRSLARCAGVVTAPARRRPGFAACGPPPPAAACRRRSPTLADAPACQRCRRASAALFRRRTT